MKAITIRQPWASLIAAGVKTIETRPRSTSYRGRIAIHAGKARPPVVDFGHWSVPPVEDVLCEWTERDGRPAVVRKLDLPLGAVVASAVLTDCAPIGGPTSFSTGIFEGDVGDYHGQAVVALHPDYGHGESLVLSNADTSNTDITDQLPYGDFSVARGRWALLLDDVKPTTERCPWCWGADDGFDTPCLKPDHGYDPECFSCQYSDCPGCGGAGVCAPVPARGQRAVPWRWTS